MKRLLIIPLLLAGLVLSAPVALAVYDPLNRVCVQDPSSSAYNSPTCQQYRDQQGHPDNNPVAGPSGALQTVTNVMALLTGIVAVVMIIASGINFMTAGGNIAGQRAGDNPGKAKKARSQLSAAVIGLIIVALSWSILTFIIQKFVQ